MLIAVFLLNDKLILGFRTHTEMDSYHQYGRCCQGEACVVTLETINPFSRGPFNLN